MTDFRRLSDDGADEFERGLLEAARSDAGSEVALERALGAFSASAAAGGTSAASAGAPGVPALAKIITGCMALGLFAAVLAMFRPPATRVPAHEAAAPRREASTTRPAEPPRSVSGAAEAARDQEAPGEAVPPPVEGAAPSEAAPPRRNLRTRSSVGARAPAVAPVADHVPGASPSASLLAAEVRLLQATRSALAARDSAAALALLDRHTREFGSGVLGPEAMVLRVQALIASGDARQARAIAEPFLARHPSGAHASRIRALLRSIP